MQAAGNASTLDYWAVKPRLLVLSASSLALGSFLETVEAGEIAVALLSIVLFLLCLKSLRKNLILIVAISVSLGLANTHYRAPKAGPGDISEFCKQTIYLTGTIVDIKCGNTRSKGKRITLNCQSVQRNKDLHNRKVKVSGLAQLTIASINTPSGHSPETTGSASGILEQQNSVKQELPELKQGDKVRVFGTPYRSSNCYKKKRRWHNLFLERRGIFCCIKASRQDIEHLESKNSDETKCPDYATKLAAAIVQHHKTVLGAKDGAVLSSMVLGDRAVSLDRETNEQFRACGLSHILVASGFNLTVVAGSMYFLLRLICGNFLLANAGSFLAMLAFLAIAGPSASILRAFIMSTLFLASNCLSKTLHLPAVLSASMLLVLLMDPWSVADPGFQFSYLATAGIIFGAPTLEKFLQTWVKLKWARTIISASLIVQLALLPLQLYYFKSFASLFLPANLIVLPLVPALSIAGFASSTLFSLELGFGSSHILSTALDKICSIPLYILRELVASLAAIPYAQIKTGKPDTTAVIVYYSVLFLFPLMNESGKMKLYLSIFMLSIMIVLVSLFHPD